MLQKNNRQYSTCEILGTIRPLVGYSVGQYIHCTLLQIGQLDNRIFCHMLYVTRLYWVFWLSQCCFMISCIIYRYINFIPSSTVCCCSVFWPPTCNNKPQLLLCALLQQKYQCNRTGVFLLVLIHQRVAIATDDTGLVTVNSGSLYRMKLKICLSITLIELDDHLNKAKWVNYGSA